MTARLLALLEHDWVDFDGWCLSQGVDALEMDIDRLLNLVVWWAIRNADDPKAIEKWKQQLYRPPGGIKRSRETQPWTQADERRSFEALKMATGN